MTPLSSQQRLATCQSFSKGASVFALLTGGLALAGWLFGIEILKSAFPGLVTMKANTALAFILAGAALWWLQEGPREISDFKFEIGKPRRRPGQICAGMVLLVGLLTLSEYLLGWDLGIDQMLFRDLAEAAETNPPGRMAVATALNFSLLGAGLLLLDAEAGPGHRPAQWLSLVVVLISLVALVGYAYGVQSLYGVGFYASMALPTVVGLLALAAGVLSARPDRGLMTLVTSASVGGLLIRRLLPAAAGTVLVLGWLRLLGERRGLYRTEFGLALMAVSSMAILALLIWWSAGSLHQTDVERRRAEEALRRSERLFVQLFELAPDGLVVVDAGGRITRVNAQTEKLFGYGRDELLGQPMEILLPERYRGRHVSQREGYMKEPRQRPMGAGLELWGRHKDASEFPVDIMLSPLQTSHGCQVLSVVHDITARKRDEERIRRYAEDLRRSNQELEHFAYVASHDLQEPLRTVASFAQLLSRRYQGRLDADADDFLGFMADGAARMQTLINDLLAFSRVGTRGKPFEPVPCEKVLQAALANLELAIAESGAVITHDPLPTVLADESQWVQLLQNLLGNAIKFRRPAETPRVLLGVARQPGAWHFSVRDNGLGIAPQYFERIFIIFQRLHSRDTYPGTGIGLAICKKIVERHGGRIWVESEPGHGATFHFTIPDRTTGTA